MKNLEETSVLKNGFINIGTVMFNVYSEERRDGPGDEAIFDNYIDVIINPTSDNLQKLKEDIKALYFKLDPVEIDVMFYGKESYLKEKLEILLDEGSSSKKVKKMSYGYSARFPSSITWSFEDFLNEVLFHTPHPETVCTELKEGFSCPRLDFRNIPISIKNIKDLHVKSLYLTLRDEEMMCGLIENSYVDRLSVTILSGIPVFIKRGNINNTVTSLSVYFYSNLNYKNMTLLTDYFPQLNEFYFYQHNDLKYII